MREWPPLAQSTPAEEPSFDASSLAAVYGYKEGWGALSPELADDLLRLMAPGGMQSESTSIEEGEGEKDDPRGTDTGD